MWRRDYISEEQLKGVRLEKGEVLAGRPDVSIEEFTHHISMMDFNLPISRYNLTRIKDFLRAIKRANGVILSSGRSYYYGLGLLSECKINNPDGSFCCQKVNNFLY